METPLVSFVTASTMSAPPSLEFEDHVKFIEDFVHRRIRSDPAHAFVDSPISVEAKHWVLRSLRVLTLHKFAELDQQVSYVRFPRQPIGNVLIEFFNDFVRHGLTCRRRAMLRYSAAGR